jgi:hypothetical protein
MHRHQSGLILLVIWIASNGAFDFWLHGVLRQPEFYWMFVAVVVVISLGILMDLEHRLCLAGWQNPVRRMFRRNRSGADASAQPPAPPAQPLSFGATDDEIHRYCAFVQKLKSEYDSSLDFDTHIELELSHFRPDGSVVLNAYAKTPTGVAMLGLVKARLAQQ